MSYFSPVPPGDRTYAKNYRTELEPYEAQLVEVSGRVKEFRDHTERKDLQSILLVNVQIRPVGKRRLIKLSHLWVLAKHVKRVGVEPKKGRRLKFIGSVYAYFRLGGKSKQRGLLGYHDFSILPMEAVAIKTFEPGINARYENKENGTGPPDEKDGSDCLGESPASGPKHDHNRHRDNGTTVPRSGNRNRKSVHDKHSRTPSSRKPRKSRKNNPDGISKDPRN